MKRMNRDDGGRWDGADDDEGGNKRSRVDLEGKYEIRILIQSKNAGGVIGKGGENIKRLRSQYTATVSVPDSNSPERIISVVAEPENALDCVREVLPKLDESKSAQDDDLELRLLVHQSHAGAIIGRSGFKIKELREKTETNLKVFSQCCPASSDRVLIITGPADRILDAVREVQQLIGDMPIKGSNKPYDTINYDPTFTFDYGGFPPDKNWRGPPPMPRGPGYGGPPGRESGGSGGGGRFGGPPRGPPAGGGGGRYERGPPPALGAGGFDRGGGGGGYRGAYGGGDAPMGGGYGGMPPPPPPAPGGGGGPMQTTQVTIPADLGGTIIGKGGERINRIREDSGAHIVIEPPAQATDERIITISGTPAQIQMAQYLLQQCVRSSATGRKYIQDQQSMR